MRRFTFITALCLLLPISFEARGDMFGGDVAVLTQILVQTDSGSWRELKSILQNGSDTLSLLQDINRGINDSLRMADTLGLRIDPGLYRDLRKVDQAAHALEQLYGRPIDSPVATVQRNTDQTVAEAISFNNELNEYAQNLDRVGEDIKADFALGLAGRCRKTHRRVARRLDSCRGPTAPRHRPRLKAPGAGLAVQNKRKRIQRNICQRGPRTSGAHDLMAATFDVPRF